MTMKLLEGYDHMSSIALLAPKGWASTLGAGGNNVASIVAGRVSGNAYRVTHGNLSNANSTTLIKALPAVYTQFVIGFALRMSNTTISQRDFMLLTSSVSPTCRVQLNTNGKIVIQNSSGTTIATGTTALTTNVWNFIEAKFVINGASGAVTVQLNGAAEIATTTGNFGSTGVDAISLPNINQSSHSGITVDWDDIYFLDTSASPNNNFLGDMHVYTLYPSADGTYSQWTPDSGSPHFSRVNEHSTTYPDGDTSYVADSTSGHRDSYAFDDLVPLTGTVFGVQSNLYARKDDVGLRQIVSSVRSGGTDYDSAVTQTLSTSYVDYTDIREVDPSTSAAWVISGVNAAEYGIKVV